MLKVLLSPSIISFHIINRHIRGGHFSVIIYICSCGEMYTNDNYMRTISHRQTLGQTVLEW